MANINDYLVWRGDLPISKEYPFNEIDALILGRFSYLLFYKIRMNKKETVKSISNKMTTLENDEFLSNGDKEMIANLGKSIRFKDMLITDYERNNDKDIEIQYSAITIHISEKELYVSYIGTDNTLHGWKESLSMMYLKDLPCQEMGKEYLERIGNAYPSKRIRVGGHSKGGNIAIYASFTSSKSIRNRIEKIYNYDGPGFRKNFFEKYQKEDLLRKVETYIPQDSIVGRLLYHQEKTALINSIEKSYLQHDIFSWEVLKDHLVRAKKLTKDSEIFDETVTKWFEETTDGQRKIVVNTVFEVLYSTNIDNVDDISKSVSKILPEVLKEYRKISKRDRAMINKAVTTMLKIYIQTRSNKRKKEEKDDKSWSIIPFFLRSQKYGR
jgi:hypothetical protein